MNHLVSRLLCGAGLAGALIGFPTAFAQSAPVVSRPVVQALPSADSKRLSTALSVIGRNPRDVAALIEAGDAARAMQDYAAALGFYRRADEASPGNARVKAGMGSAFVLSGDPVSAIPLFDEADKAGAIPALIAADRGLAYDLVGNNDQAQRYYTLALASASGALADDLRTRLAVSQAIDGDGDAAYRTLLPLLNKQDKPGWRTRAFTLAIAGQTGEAVDVAQKILPAPLAENIAPYLRYMPRLTRAQQAAAANLGRFPRASEIGRDDARIAAYAPPHSGAAGNALIPRGEPLGATGAGLARATPPGKAIKGAGGRGRGRQVAGAQPATAPRTSLLANADPDRVAPRDVRPTIEREADELPPVGRSAASSAQPSLVATPRPVLAPNPGPAQAPAPVPSRAAQASPSPIVRTPAPGFDLARISATEGASPPPPPRSSPPTAAPVAAPVAPLPSGITPAAVPPPASPAAPSAPQADPVPTPGPAQLSLAEIFADLGKPTIVAAPAPGAVDIRMITPAAPRPAPAPAPTRIELPRVADPASVEPKAKAEPRGKVDAAEKDGKPAEIRANARTRAAEAKAAADAKAKARKPAPPSHPSRIWVQIGVGRDKAAIAFDWRRHLREKPTLFRGREPFVSDMGRTNRVLIGPFATQRAAAAFIADARKQGLADALPWTSPAGQVVDALSAQ